MSTVQKLFDLVKNGKKPIVTFKKGIEDKDAYAESGMRARAVRVETSKIDDSVHNIFFAFEEFTDHNMPLESSNYYDKSGSPTLNARQAGFYFPEESMYFCLYEKLEGLMDIESDDAVALFDAYMAEKSGLTYLQWLEAKVLALP